MDNGFFEYHKIFYKDSNSKSSTMNTLSNEFNGFEFSVKILFERQWTLVLDQSV